MKLLPTLTFILAFGLVLPAVNAGDVNAPELRDPAGDAPPQVDVVAAWFTPYPPSTNPTTGLPEQCVTGPVAGTQCVNVDCDFLVECRRAFRVYVQLKDLLATSQPLADEDPMSTRYQYEISFQPSNYERVTIVCVVNYAELTRSVFGGLVGSNVDQVGRWCRIPADGSPGDAYTVVNSAAVRTESSFFVTLAEDLASLEPGIVMSGLTVTSSIGKLQTTAPVLGRYHLADTTVAGSSYTVQ